MKSRRERKPSRKVKETVEFEKEEEEEKAHRRKIAKRLSRQRRRLLESAQ